MNSVPAELRTLPRWVLWRFETRDDKRTKVPYSVTGQRASTTNPTTWSSFADARAATERVGADGIGFVFSGDDNVIGVDLDHVRDPASGAIKPWALDVIEALQSYTELSPSATGFHIILRGIKRSAQCNLRFDPVTREGFEIYSTARYFTITGEHLAGTPLEINTVSDSSLARVLTAMQARLPKKEISPALGSRVTEPVSILGDVLLRRMFHSRDGAEIARLYHGHADYPSPSEADIALCGRLAFWTGKDHAQMDRLFRSSGLMRDKWDARRGDSTYGALTIAKAIANCRETYSAAVTNRTVSCEQRAAELPPAAHEWIVERREAFTFPGPSGNPAIADLAIVTRDGSPPVVVATERDDNPGVSVTNGAEQLAAQILIGLFPERADQDQPFRLVVHYRAASFGAAGRVDPSMEEVRFRDFRVRQNGPAPRIGDAFEWKSLDARVAAVLAAQTTAQRTKADTPQRVRQQASSRGMRR